MRRKTKSLAWALATLFLGIIAYPFSAWIFSVVLARVNASLPWLVLCLLATSLFAFGYWLIWNAHIAIPVGKRDGTVGLRGARKHPIRTGIFLLAVVLYLSGWMLPIIVGSGPDSGSSYAPFFRAAFRWFRPSEMHPFIPWLLLTVPWVVTHAAVLRGILLRMHDSARTSEEAYRRWRWLGAAAVFNPLFQWGWGGICFQVSMVMMFAALTTLKKAREAPNQASDASSEPAPSAASSSHQG